MTRYDITNEYFDWLSGLVCGQRYSGRISYKKLLSYLHETEFRWLLPLDENRAKEGETLRYRFCLACGYESSVEIIIDILDGPCSMLEMLVALAVHCEDTQYDPDVGDRTGQWFWSMITNLGLGSMTDDKFDWHYTDMVVTRFLNREYAPNGKGGLFTIRNYPRDLRDVEIWKQLCWYLGTIM